MNKDDFEKYKMLSDEVKYNHDRWDVLLRTILTIHGFIVAGIAMLYREESKEFGILICVLSIAGIVICFSGYFVLRRILYIAQLRFYQLRKYEEEMNKDNPNKKYYKNIFIYGWYFTRGKLEEGEYEEILGDKKGKDKIKRLKYLPFVFIISIILGSFYTVALILQFK